MAQPQARRGAEVGRGQLVLGEAIQLPASAGCRGESVAETLSEAGEHADLGRAGRVVPLARVTAQDVGRRDEWLRVFGRRRLRRRVLGLGDEVWYLTRVNPSPRNHADARLAITAADRDDRQLA